MPHSLAAQLADTLADGGWRSKARPSQLPPPGDWNGWLVLAGRGFGKTRTGCEFVQEQVESGEAKRIALVAPTSADCRDVMVEGESGFLSIAPAWCRPEYEPSKRRLTWPNGAVASTFSAEEADRLRGPQFDLALCDEVAAWPNPADVWAMLMFGLRLGQHPRWVATTTPRPIKLLKELIVRDDVVVTRGTTFENADNLAPAFLAVIRARYDGTRLGRQELNAELLEDMPGALWTRSMIDAAKIGGALPPMRRIVVAIDPSGTRGSEDGGDPIGIIVAGRGHDGLGYVLADRTCKLSPAGWARVAVAAYHEFRADRIIAERNFGGAMVEATIRMADPNVSYREVTASRGKAVRAEPIAALYEQGRVKHAGSFPELEDQMCLMAPDGFLGDGSPDRLDALVWALTDLCVRHPTPQAVFGTWTMYADPPEPLPPAALAALGRFHPVDRQKWIDRGVYKPPAPQPIERKPGMGEVETVKIINPADETGGYKIINKTDFDPAKHKLHESSGSTPKAEKEMAQ